MYYLLGLGQAGLLITKSKISPYIKWAKNLDLGLVLEHPYLESCTAFGGWACLDTWVWLCFKIFGF